MPFTAGLMAHICGGWVRCSREAVMKICLEVLVLPGLKQLQNPTHGNSLASLQSF